MNPKAKGNRFEREISKLLSLWFSNGTDDDLFWRTQSSGGRFTQRKKLGKDTRNQSSDITSTSLKTKLFSDLFSIEAKHYKNVDLWTMVSETKGNGLLTWWIKLHDECKQTEKFPILIVKQNNKPVLFICDENLTDKLTIYYNAKPIFHYFGSETVKEFYVYRLDDILKLDIETFKCILKEISEII